VDLFGRPTLMMMMMMMMVIMVVVCQLCLLTEAYCYVECHLCTDVDLCTYGTSNTRLRRCPPLSGSCRKGSEKVTQ